MRKKLFLTFVLVLAFVLTLSIVAFADTVHNENTVDYDATVTLNDGTVLSLYNENNEALIWYISGTNEEGKSVYSSIRTDDSQVLWNTKSWGEVTGVSIVLANGTRYNVNQFVVVNMMDDDVVSNSPEGDHTNLGDPITGFKWLFNGATNLEYAYLRLDTSGVYQYGFQGCSKLKYINLEDLKQLNRLGNAGIFNGCTSLFEGQVLDLSKTKLEKIDDGGEIFKDVPIKGIILPETFWRFSASNTFKDCTLLETVVIGNKISQVGIDIFNGCTSLRAIFFVGTEEELDAFVTNAEAAGNNEEITGATKISYKGYKALSDNEKAENTYIVYDYSWCEAYNDSLHEVEGSNPCVGTCSVCQNDVVSHIEGQLTSVKVEYADFSKSGLKITTCNNDGCTYKVSEELFALFTCQGYSAAKTGNGISLGFKVNGEAVNTYTSLTGNTIKYGVFAVAQGKLGENDIFDENGNATDGVISAEIKNTEFNAFDIKIIGFETDLQKSTLLALGAYVEVLSQDKEPEYSYMQENNPNDGEKYHFIKYNDIVK